MVDKELLLKYASYKLKKSCRPHCQRTRFYKLFYLLNKELKKNGLDIELPYAWYQYGVILDKDPYYYNIDYSTNFSRIADGIKREISSGISNILRIHGFRETGEINSEIYEEAPFNFQIEFRQIMLVVDYWEEGKLPYKYFNPYNVDLKEQLHKLTLEFPKKEFSDLYKPFLEWKNIVSYMLDHHPSERKELITLFKQFWRLYAKKLRILENENISQSTIEDWRSKYHEAYSDFEIFIFDYNLKFYEEYYNKTDEHTEVVNGLHELASKTIWE